MRTSGVGREGWMTAIPLVLLVFFLVGTYGGPRPALRLVEATLWSFAEWALAFIK